MHADRRSPTPRMQNPIIKWIELVVLILFIGGEVWAISQPSTGDRLLNIVGLVVFSTAAVVVGTSLRRRWSVQEQISAEREVRARVIAVTASTIAALLIVGALLFGVLWLLSVPSWAAVIIALLVAIVVMLARIKAKLGKVTDDHSQKPAA
jgi:protein-S-isoprenylcysteine O-methyltransferase Ste14